MDSGTSNTAMRQNRHVAIHEAMGRLHCAVDRLAELEAQIHSGVEPESPKNPDAAPVRPTPPLAELLEGMAQEIHEIVSRIEERVRNIRDFIF